MNGECRAAPARLPARLLQRAAPALCTPPQIAHPSRPCPRWQKWLYPPGNGYGSAGSCPGFQQWDTLPTTCPSGCGGGGGDGGDGGGGNNNDGGGGGDPGNNNGGNNGGGQGACVGDATACAPVTDPTTCGNTANPSGGMCNWDQNAGGR